LRLAIVSSLLHPRYGGPSGVVKMHAEALSSHANITVFGCSPEGKQSEVTALFPNAHIFPETWPRRWFRGAGLRRALRDVSSQCDAFHAHMLWDHPTWATWRVAKKVGKPFVVTPHGSLSAIWRTGAPHKRLYSWLVLDGLLGDVGALHAFNKAEADAFRAWGFEGRIAVIPNGLPVTEFERNNNPEVAWRQWPVIKGRRVMMYLGRLWWQKGLDILPEAWKEAKLDDDWILSLTGPDYRGYQKKLEADINALGLKSRIIITGPVGGEIKASLFAASECLILPSYSEGFSMVLIEAMAAGLPCIFTRECHFPELAAHGGGWEIPLKKEDIVQTLQFVCSRSPEENRASGKRGRELGYSKYTTEYIGKELLGLYQSLLENS
jgi:glycosyltransferase involved in cell wall biosynthesis